MNVVLRLTVQWLLLSFCVEVVLRCVVVGVETILDSFSDNERYFVYELFH